MSKNPEFTQVRVKKTDHDRINRYLDILKKSTKIGRVSTLDVITVAMDALEEKEQKKQSSMS